MTWLSNMCQMCTVQSGDLSHPSGRNMELSPSLMRWIPVRLSPVSWRPEFRLKSTCWPCKLRFAFGHNYLTVCQVLLPIVLFLKRYYPCVTDKTTEARRSIEVVRLRIEPPNISFSHDTGKMRQDPHWFCALQPARSKVSRGGHACPHPQRRCLLTFSIWAQ